MRIFSQEKHYPGTIKMRLITISYLFHQYIGLDSIKNSDLAKKSLIFNTFRTKFTFQRGTTSTEDPSLSLPATANRSLYRTIITMRHLLLSLIMAATLAGCMANPVRNLTQHLSEQPGLDEIQRIFEETGKSLISELRRLINYTGEQLDLQTALTLETVRLSPAHVADRGVFYREAEKLDSMLSEIPAEEIPLDSAVLDLLAKLASGKPVRQHYLEDEDADDVIRLCGPARAMQMKKDDHLFEKDDDLLRQSCFKWLLGDAAKSRALFYYLRAGKQENDIELTSATPFEAFIHRLYQESGIDLMDHRKRLSVYDRGDQQYADNLFQRKTITVGQYE